MFAERWLYDFLIYLYALSLLFSFSDLLYPNPRSRYLSNALLVGVWLIQSTSFIFEMFSIWSVSIQVDALFIYSWALVTFTLVINGLYRRMDLFAFCSNLIGFTVLAFHLFFARDLSMEYTKLLLSELGFVHISFSILSYAAFSLSSICSALYLMNNYLLKKKKWNKFLMRLPSLDRLQIFSRYLVLIGTPLLCVAMILGFIWIYQLIGRLFWYDLKIWASFLVLVVYGFVLYQWVANRWNGRRLAWWNTLAFLSILLNVVISGTHVSFHHWF
ncbi:cytochrome C assembly family protein [Thermoflavimicrobium dichotomicum]|uniref:HemX protein n=1 Tax=Thermoflavimicrobium dichotomicum TaxID=46223 RepID=A0A1I3R9J2_9BACL|nr:cytochrome c biogenesis protein CcsA [Thermoflavimicrobium dichotomicum]SFJ42452.1 HemX protein [Thermoflavimicrobium dichotomicum]